MTSPHPYQVPTGQGLVYIGLAGLLLGKLASLVLPGAPTLLQVALARGALGGVLAFAAAGAGYVRGAVNARALTPTESVHP